MFERFAREAKIVVEQRREPRRASLGSATIEAEHLLLALTDCEARPPRSVRRSPRPASTANASSRRWRPSASAA